MPVAAPIGFSGAFSNVLASVVSAQRFSESDGCRPSKTSAIGLSATPLGSFFLFTKSAIEGFPGSIIEDAEKTGQEAKDYPVLVGTFAAGKAEAVSRKDWQH